MLGTAKLFLRLFSELRIFEVYLVLEKEGLIAELIEFLYSLKLAQGFANVSEPSNWDRFTSNCSSIFVVLSSTS